MQPTPNSLSRGLNAEDFEFQRLLASVRRHALPIVTAGLLAGGLSAYLSSRQAPVYEAVSTVVASRTDGSGNSVINTSLVAAPQLPQGAVEEALHSEGVVNDIIARLGKSTELNAAQIATLTATLQNDLIADRWGNLKVEAKTDSQQAGTYAIHTQGGSPLAARVLADQSVAALLAWDVGRAQRRIARARSGLEAQLGTLGTQLAAKQISAQDAATLTAARAQVVQNLAQVAVLEQAAFGTLDPVAEAIEPRSPVSPVPLKNGLLGALLALLLGSVVALLGDSLRRRIYGEQDISGSGLPLLGKLPLVSGPALRGGLIEAARSGALYMGAGFLRVNVMAQLAPGKPRRIVISSARPGEGKSSVTAALATGLAASGLKVLIVDADLHRPSQPQIWQAFGNPMWHLMPSCRLENIDPRRTMLEPAQTLSTGLDRLDEVQVLAVAENIDLLPAGRPMKDSSSVVGHARLPEALERWGEAYDVVLIDTPPLLVLSDALAFAAYTEGLILVTEAGVTTMQELERAMSSVQTVGARLLGLVLNKQTRREDNTYTSYADRYEAPSRRGGQDKRASRQQVSGD
ncbi:P-loop NTPase [Deinococcus sp.]|uniref:polysaccharide biosynthesis tyrosine autokinase n=1 Tax=Deinococcus sp. TaxID=47478 RepID=UPI003C7C07DE